MLTLREIADALRARARAMSMTQEQLGTAAGVSRRTMTHVLTGVSDYKMTTLLALLDRLGLELVLVPKGAAAGLGEPLEPQAPAVKTRIQAARERHGPGVARDAASEGKDD